jgi:uncharacterized damage-inducible protein DinB
MTDLADELVDALAIHDRITLYLLDAVPDEALLGTGGRKARKAGEMFAHIHNVRVDWLKSVAPAADTGVAKLPKEAAGDKAALRSALEASSEALRSALVDILASGQRPRGFKPHAAAFVGYLIAHQAYHHGEIGVAVAEDGHRFDNKVGFGMWEWGVR